MTRLIEGDPGYVSEDEVDMRTFDGPGCFLAKQPLYDLAQCLPTRLSERHDGNLSTPHDE
jgi:hypothetical protein